MLMEDSCLNKELRELHNLLKKIGSLPTEEQKGVVELNRQTSDVHKGLRENISKLQSSMDYLRIVVKYLAFDLEATKRENEILKRLLEQRD
jgi:hypothetical protein